ncbi:MAG: 4Fe-4S binding protein [Phycisphaerae bacterium]|nr:4Fe-4S binding protein [Phycisphaerae bacterium]
MAAVVDKEKCTGCEACVGACPAEAISMDSDGKAVVDAGACSECGVCVDECPVEAISMA